MANYYSFNLKKIGNVIAEPQSPCILKPGLVLRAKCGN